MRRNLILSLIAFVIAISLIFIFGCESKKPVQPELSQGNELTTTLAKNSVNTGGLEEATVSPFLGELNSKLASDGKTVRIALAEWITDASTGEIGRTVYFADIGNKQLSSHWVPGDPNRDYRTDITWADDQVDKSDDLPLSETNAAIDRAMDTWDNVQCSTIPLEKVNDYGLDLGYVQYLVGMGGVYGWLADITHAGWLNKAFFNAIAPPDGGDYILGATFTFIWVDDQTGDPTDMDNNGKNDVAFREIYYNNSFHWAIDANYDVESIALHEVGHGLSQAHFGTAFRTTSDNKLHFSPRTVMNAGYSGVQQELTGTDTAGHCSIWASWPNY
jgi:hypothetical protein